MKLKDVELLPGVVVDADDPLHRGRVKLTVPGVFDSTIMSVEGLPWVCPLFMFGYQQYSKLETGSKVWLFKIENNMKELWYVPMFSMNNDANAVIEDGEDADVLFSRTGAGTSAAMNYHPNSGLTMSVIDKAKINLSSEGNTTISGGGGDAQISLNNERVVIGNAESAEPLVKGNKLKTLLTNLQTGLTNLSTAAAGSITQDSIPLSAFFSNVATQLGTDMENLFSTVSKTS